MCFDYTHGRQNAEPSAAGKNQSLLKPYTNNDRINDMSVDEKAEFIVNEIRDGNLSFIINTRVSRQLCVEAIKKFLQKETKKE